VAAGRQRPLGVGFVGCGFATARRHLPAIARVREVRAVAVADLDRGRVAEVAARHGIAGRYATVRELVADREVDVVAVCVPAGAHVEVALAAIEAGKHVLVEKPLAASLDEAEQLVERASRGDVSGTVGFNLRHHRLVRTASALVRAGAIGALEAVRTAFSDPILDTPDLPAWRARREAGGGALFEKAIHHVDLWRFLLDDDVDEVAAFGRSGRGDDQTVAIVARTRRGLLAEAFVSDATATGNEVALYGTGGALFLDLYRSDGIRLVGAGDLPGAVRTRIRQLLSATGQKAANIREIARGGAFAASYEEQWRAFAEAIRRGRRPAPGLEDGLRALEVVVAAARSMEVGAAVGVGVDAHRALTGR
jgi:predicted dehydrogenase